jgi:hypothetical protein
VPEGRAPYRCLIDEHGLTRKGGAERVGVAQRRVADRLQTPDRARRPRSIAAGPTLPSLRSACTI